MMGTKQKVNPMKRNRWIFWESQERSLALFLVLLGALSACITPTTPPGTQPGGTLLVNWNPTAHRVTVSLRLTGLTPFGRYPAQIQEATSCQMGGPLLFSLHPVEANANGIGTSTTAIENASQGIPRQGWVVIVQMRLALSARYPLVCVVIHRSTRLPGFTLHYTIELARPAVGKSQPE